MINEKEIAHDRGELNHLRENYTDDLGGLEDIFNRGSNDDPSREELSRLGSLDDIEQGVRMLGGLSTSDEQLIDMVRSQLDPEMRESLDRFTTMDMIAHPQYEIMEDVGQYQPSELQTPAGVVARQRTTPTLTLSSNATNHQTEMIRDREREAIQRDFNYNYTSPTQLNDRTPTQRPTPLEREEVLSDTHQSEINDFMSEVRSDNNRLQGRLSMINQSLTNPSERLYDPFSQSHSRMRAVGKRENIISSKGRSSNQNVLDTIQRLSTQKQFHVEGVGTDNITLPARKGVPTLERFSIPSTKPNKVSGFRSRNGRMKMVKSMFG